MYQIIQTPRQRKLYVLFRTREVLGNKQATLWLDTYLPQLGGSPREVADTEPRKVLLVLDKIENGVY